MGAYSGQDNIPFCKMLGLVLGSTDRPKELVLGVLSQELMRLGLES